MSPIPSLSLLRSFEAAAEFQNFTAAAESLRISQGAISRQVRELEGIIGTALFRKEGRGVVLTTAGCNLAENLRGDLGRLRQTINRAQVAGEAGQSLTIAALPTFAARWLAPRLPRFQEIEPDVQIICHSRSLRFDIANEGIDVAIFFGGPEWVGAELTQLCPEDLVVVAAPEIVARFEISRTQDFARLPLVHQSTRSAAWPDFFAQHGLDTAGALAGATFDQFATAISATVHGLGAAIVPTYLIEDELTKGSLVVLGRGIDTGGMYYIAQPKGIENNIADRFSVWAREEARLSTQNRERPGIAVG